jgi:hypothetical protein
MKCSRPICERPVYCMRLCRRCYAKAWRANACGAGRYRRVDPGPVLAHLKRLRELGWTWELMSQRTGLGPHTASNVFKRGTVSHTVANALLALPLEEAFPALRLLDPTGTRRRVEALNYMGWTRRYLEQRMGMGVCALSKILREGRVTPRTASLVADLYSELSGQLGPNRRVADEARAAGYQPPMAWEYADIDDPKAKPFGGFARSA